MVRLRLGVWGRNGRTRPPTGLSPGPRARHGAASASQRKPSADGPQQDRARCATRSRGRRFMPPTSPSSPPTTRLSSSASDVSMVPRLPASRSPASWPRRSGTRSPVPNRMPRRVPRCLWSHRRPCCEFDYWSRLPSDLILPPNRRRKRDERYSRPGPWSNGHGLDLDGPTPLHGEAVRGIANAHESRYDEDTLTAELLPEGLRRRFLAPTH